MIPALLLAALAAATPDSETWTFDRTDRLGAYPATVLGAPHVIDTPVGKAVAFNGVDDALLLDVHPLAGAAQFTWEVIFRPDSGGSPAQRFFHLQEHGAETRLLFEIRILDGRWCLDSYARSGEAGKTLIDRAKLHSLDRWYHAALVYDGRELRNYVDGVLEGRAEVALAPQRPGQTSIGVRINRVDYFKGAIRASRMTRRALAPGDFLKVQP
jgi:hypothetical protein